MSGDAYVPLAYPVCSGTRTDMHFAWRRIELRRKGGTLDEWHIARV